MLLLLLACAKFLIVADSGSGEVGEKLKEELLRKKAMKLMIWDLSAHVLKMRHKLLGKHILNMGETDQTFAGASERSKVQSIQSHRRFFEEMRPMTHGSS